jgi:uncharacterized repeat protein (TIGR01451 family)
MKPEGPVLPGKRLLITVLAWCILSASWSSDCAAERIFPSMPAVAQRLAKGEAQNLLFLFDDSAVEAEAAGLRQRSNIRFDDDSILAVRSARYRLIKQGVMAGFARHEAEEVRDFDHLPMSLLRVKSRAALDRLMADPKVVAVYEDAPIHHHLSYSLPFINQPAVANAGYAGSGQTVAVIDTGIDYTLATFGSCTSPGIPAGCRVTASVDVTGNNVTLNQTPGNHGTNVAGVVAGVAPGAKIAAVNAFYGGGSTTSWVIAGINWAISNKSAYNIGVLNMSLGDGAKNTIPCGSLHLNPFVSPINNARAAGIVPVASSGNEAYTDGIANPACTPGVVSVGAVYDASWGGPYSWGGTPPTCTDTSASVADRIPCFSNSASFLTLLAPGAFITAAGIQMAGTSQASPHVAGAIAVMRAAYPSDTLDQTVARLTSNGVTIIDSRNGIGKPRLNLLAAISPPANDLFANRSSLSGDAGQITTSNLNATKESGEPSHAGNSGGRSVWWRWIPSVSGIASFDTHGSSFNTLLAVYSGASLTSLTQMAANDNDGSSGSASGVTFTAQAGTEYVIAVDGFNGATGQISLNWNLAQQADLAIALSQGPASPFAGDYLTYTMTVINHGPSAANGVVVTDILPPGVFFISASPGCSRSGGTVACITGTLANNSSATFQVEVQVLNVGDLVNSVQVSSATGDPQASDNSATSTLTVSPVAAVPALSLWGVIVSAACLAGIARRANTRIQKTDML